MAKNTGIFFLLLTVLLGNSFSTNSNQKPKTKAGIQATEKINAVSFVAPPRQVSPNVFDAIAKVAANWVCLMPFGYGRADDVHVYYDSEWQWWGERTEGIKATVDMAHQKQYKVMLKPQLWFRHGSYTGAFTLSSEQDWQTWEQDYETFILTYAKIAQSKKVEMLCIGTELKLFVANRPAFWKQLIAKVRNIYKGKLTYAANWDDYKAFPHWKLLDYIGIDAYFPLSDAVTPKVNALKQAWKTTAEQLKAFSQAIGKPILFTEYGYRSIDQTAFKPWESDRRTTINMQAQVNAYEALYATFWKKPWFAGGFLWKWFHNYDKAGGTKNGGFTPQNKLAIHTIKKWYSSPGAN